MNARQNIEKRYAVAYGGVGNHRGYYASIKGSGNKDLAWYIWDTKEERKIPSYMRLKREAVKLAKEFEGRK